MSKMKIVVPEEMLEETLRDKGFLDWMKMTGKPLDEAQYCQLVKEVVKAALRWQIENPRVPTDEDLEVLQRDAEGKVDLGFARRKWYITEWQRQMFLAPKPEERDIFQSLKGRTFTQEESDMVYDYVQRSVHGGRCPCMRDKKDTLEPEVDIRTQVHRMFHKLWTASVGTEGYDKEHWNKMDGLLQNALYPPNKSAE